MKSIINLLLSSACILAYQNQGLAQDLEFNFCKLTDSNAPALRDSQQVWGAQQVQRMVRETALSIRSSILSAYTSSYIAMTEQRDIERCQGQLAADDMESELIGDRLADIMSRYYLLQARACVENEKFDGNFSGFCQDVRDVRGANYDALSGAMINTATYLSSHMSQSLAALIYDDIFWLNFPDQATHQGFSRLKDLVDARIFWVRRYKGLYDKNNAFLADNLSTVANSLVQGCYLKSSQFSTVASLAKLIPGKSLLFGSVRDQTFETAIQLAQQILQNPSRHPMIVKVGTAYQLNFGSYKSWKDEPEILISLKKLAREKFFPPGSFLLFKGFGGLDQKAYTRALARDCAGN